MKTVAFRVDAATHVGSGHVMRSLTLARALRRRGCAVTFVMRARPGDLRELVLSEGFAVAPLAADAGVVDTWLGASLADEIAASQRALAPLGCPLLVVDHYRLGASWERAMRSVVAGIVAVDDLADRAHDCDVLIDAAPEGERGKRYRPLVPAHCTLLLGPRYALLREEFRAPMLRRRERDGSIARVLVSYGGFDAHDATSRALAGLARMKIPAAIDVVLPPQAPNAEAVQRLCAEIPHARFLGRESAMAERMEQVDLALGAGGTAALERCALGLPTILSALADNQRVNVASIVRAGAAVELPDITPESVAAAATGLLRDPQRVGRMARAARDLAGGTKLGTDRVVERLAGMLA